MEFIMVVVVVVMMMMMMMKMEGKSDTLDIFRFSVWNFRVTNLESTNSYNFGF
jgi:hypothetical protein